MGFLQDNLIPFFKKRSLVFRESMQQSEDVYSFVFEKPSELTWKPGQYGLFTITHKRVKQATKPFSVSSIPSEGIVRMTTIIRDNPSAYKQALLELKPGMSVTLRGPVGPFYLTDHSPTLLIAGGIGITPFRSIVKQLAEDGTKVAHPVHLLYIDSNQSYVFQDELDELANQASILVTYVDVRADLQREIDVFTSAHANNGKYLVAGSSAMTGDITTYLQQKQIAKANIKKDVFMGY